MTDVDSQQPVPRATPPPQIVSVMSAVNEEDLEYERVKDALVDVMDTHRFPSDLRHRLRECAQGCC